MLRSVSAYKDGKMTFGQLITDARKKAHLSQRELAALLKKEDGEPISPQYLNDLERDRRNPPSDLIIKQLAEILRIDLDYLYACADKFPPDIRGPHIDRKAVVTAFRSIRKTARQR
jgi:transcriptional regulator with XRE-family HTH domain